MSKLNENKTDLEKNIANLKKYEKLYSKQYDKFNELAKEYDKSIYNGPLKTFNGKIYREIDKKTSFVRNYMVTDQEGIKLEYIDIEEFFKRGGEKNKNFYFDYDSASQQLKTIGKKCIIHDGEKIDISDCNGTNNQRWKLSRSKISPITNLDKCLKENGLLGTCDETNILPHPDDPYLNSYECGSSFIK